MMLRIGLLGASRIAVPAIIEPARLLEGVVVSEIAARDPHRAESYAALHGIKAYRHDYAQLIASDNLDLIYIGLPPSEHAALCIAALDAGKHVLCEKPFAMTSADAETMVAAARRNDRLLIEAFHYRFHPLFERVIRMIADGDIGKIETIEAHFRVPIKCTDYEFRYQPDFGGGALMDLGCYTIHWARSIVGTEPIVTSAGQTLHASGVDVETSATLQFPEGELARITCAMQENLPGLDAHLSVVGTDGKIDVDNPAVPHTGHRLTLTNALGSHSEQIVGKATFYYQLEHVRDLLLQRCAPILPPDDAVNNMRVIDAIIAASRSR